MQTILLAEKVFTPMGEKLSVSDLAPEPFFQGGPKYVRSHRNAHKSFEHFLLNIVALVSKGNIQTKGKQRY
jgi:hypothetical protein